MFRAYDPQGERLVAIKLFTLDLPPERVHQLVAELEQIIAADLKHPALATPIAAGITGVSAFLATDYVAADSFDLALREHGPALPARALSAAVQLAGALDLAAAASVLHGALHPRDLLLSGDDTRLTGIGVAHALQQVGVTVPVRRPYTAPERIAGAEWDRRADVFSLAALLYELLWGKRVSGTGYRALDGLTEIEGGNLGALKRAFAHALDDDPAKRFPTAGEFAESLKHAFPGVKVSAARKRDAARRENEPRLPLDAVEPTADVPSRLDFDLHPADHEDAERRRFIDVEAPAHVEADGAASDATPLIHEPAIGPPAGLITQGAESLTVLDRSRSAVWPLVLALMLGVALGFAGGFGFRGRLPSVGGAGSDAAAAPPAPTRAPAGREFTEGTIPEPAKPAPAPPEVRATRDPAKVPVVPRPDLIGRLLIRSTPAGARVFVDDRDVGRTPASVRDVAVGAHRVRVTHEGYATEERSVTISRRKPTQAMAIALKRPAAVARGAKAASTVPPTTAGVGGVLIVDSRPTGAKVFVDGKPVGTTPMSMPAVPAGEHTIRLERDGYRHWSSSVRISPGGQNRVTASLER